MRFVYVPKIIYTEMAIYDQQNRKQQYHHDHHHRQQQQHHQQQRREQQRQKQIHRKLHNDQINIQCLKLKENILDDHYSENIKEQIMKSKSILKKRRKMLHFNGAIQNLQYCVLIVFCFLLPSYIQCQYTPHDPRFYSREGDYNYHWPNPGDPEYR